MNKQSLIIGILSTILIIIVIVLGVAGYWGYTAYSEYVDNAKEVQKRTEAQQQGGSSLGEQTSTVADQNRTVPTCYDPETLNTLRDIIYKQAEKDSQANGNQEIIDLVYQADLAFKDIVTISEATEYNPVQRCEATLDMTYPYMTEEEKEKIGTEFLTWIVFTGKKQEYESLPKRFSYEIKVAHNEGGEVDYLVEAEWMTSYSRVVGFMATRYYVHHHPKAKGKKE